MIENELQYKLTKEQATNFEHAINNHQLIFGVDDSINKACKEALVSVHSELLKQIKDYEAKLKINE